MGIVQLIIVKVVVIFEIAMSARVKEKGGENELVSGICIAVSEMSAGQRIVE